MILTLIISCITIIALILSVLLFPKITIRGKELNTYWMVGLLGMILLIVFGCIPLNDIFNESKRDIFSNSSFSINEEEEKEVRRWFISIFFLFKYCLSLILNWYKVSAFSLSLQDKAYLNLLWNLIQMACWTE